ncbi:Plasmodium variant antigen protein Cir/Yir/Bir, putative, partial [Plasmodium chabaudi adami]
CGLLFEGDSYFNGKDVNTNEINKNTSIKSYCPNDDCKTNEAGINALAAYIFMEFKESISRKAEYNKYDEWLLMWLSDKLLKMHLEIIGKKDKPGYIDGTTLNQAYEKYLKNHKVKLDYWILLDMIKGLKEANLKYMSEFYKLLNIICKTIVDYKDNNAESKKLSKNSISCLRQYRTLYMNIYECKSYLDLLNKLKGLYDDFRSYAIKRNGSKNNLETILQKLTLGNGTELEAVRKFKTYNFSNQKCYPQKKNTKPKKQNPPRLPPSPKEEPPPQPQKKDSLSPPPPSGKLKDSQHETQQSSSTTSPEDPPAKLELPSSSQESQKTGKSDQNESKDSGKETGGSKSEIKGPEVGNEKKNGEDKEPRTPSGGEGSQVNGCDRANSESGGPDTEKGGTGGGSGDPGSVSGGGQDSKVGDSDRGGGGASSDTGNSSTGSENLDNGSHDQDSGSGAGDKKGLQIGPIDSSSQPLTSDTNKEGSNDGEGNTNNEPSNGGGEQCGQDDQKTPDGSGDSETGPGSEPNPTDSTPREKETQNASWPPFDIRSYIYTIASKGMDQINNALKFFNENTEKITKAIDTINSLYNTSVSNIK